MLGNQFTAELEELANTVVALSETAACDEPTAQVVREQVGEVLQGLCASLLEDESAAAMARVDLLSLVLARLDMLGALSPQEQLESLQQLLFSLPGDEVEPVLQWVAAAEGLLDEAEYQRLSAALADAPAEAGEHMAADAAVPELSPDQHEILVLLAAELQEIAEQQQSTFEALADGQALNEDDHRTLNSISSRFEHLANVCAMVELDGLRQFFSHLQFNCEAVASSESWSTAVASLFQQGVSLAEQYVASQLAPQPGEKLAVLWQAQGWPMALGSAEYDAVREALLNPVMGELEDDRPPRMKEAQPEDVSLRAPDDVNPELLESLLNELPEQTAQLSEAIQSCIANQFMSDLDTARRIAHTLKGAANVVGIRGVATLTHQMEDILDLLAKYKTMPTGPLAETLLATTDCLETMCECLLGQGSAPEDAVVVLQQILDWANRLEEGGEAVIRKLAELPAPEVKVTQAAPRQEAAAETAGNNNNEAERSLRVSYRLIDELMRLAGEHTILSGQIQEHTGNALKHMLGVKHRSQHLRTVAQELEQLVDVRRVGVEQDQGTGDEIDPLELERYNELHTVTHRMVEAVNDVYEHLASIEDELLRLGDANVDQSRMNSQQQDAVMQTRMVPVQSVVQRLQRSVRQACRLAGKQVDLQVHGAGTLIDNDILASLVDPIMHLLRNAVDHGIENGETRVGKGKPAAGSIDLSFERRGDQIVVRCVDDGQGLNYAGIRARGLEHGLIQEHIDYAHDELARLILSPGFSTRDVVTQLSGRGVGMDVVNDQVERLKGVINISSEPGRGCEFEIALPTSLLAAHALLVEAGGANFVTTSHGISEIIFAEPGLIQASGSEKVYSVNGSVHKVTSLAGLLGLPAEEIELGKAYILLLVESNLGKKLALQVDRVIDSRDIVIKPLGDYLPKMPGLVGATILGDGSAVSVLDLPGLVRVGEEYEDRNFWTARSGTEQTQLHVLVVDDSLSTRRSLSQFVEDMGLAVVTAKDGVEAVERIRERRPDLVLADLEMPRMNGLELTAHIRSQAETADIPVIMITSRATDKHRQMARQAGVSEYLNKPYSEEQLLHCIHSLLQQGGG